MIREQVAQLLREHLGVEDIPLNTPPDRKMGDFSTAVCLSLAKKRRRPPLEIARQTVAEIGSKLPPFIKEVAVTPPGYLNFKVDWSSVAKNLIPEVIEKEVAFGKPALPQSEKVFIEHTSVNPNKAMHIGHLRNAVLGDTVARVLRWLGYSTEVCNYIDDTGVQVVDVVTALLFLDPPTHGIEDDPNFGPIWAKCPEDQPFDYFCWDLYARFENELEKNTDLLARRETILHLIERGQHPVAAFAKELARRIVEAHLATVGQLFIFYDLLNWESDIIREGFWQSTFELLKEKGSLRYEDAGPNKGCWVVPFGGVVETSEGVKSLDKILVRSNESVTYTGKDVAYQLWKFGLLKRDFRYQVWGPQPNGEDLWTTSDRGEAGGRIGRDFGHADRVINVIDVRQSYPQQVVVECLRQLGFERQADQSVHLAYEVVNLSAQAAALLGKDAPDGDDVDDMSEKKAVAMSGRAGTGVKARDFIERVKQKVIEKADHPLDEKVASALAAAAIRYYLIKFTLESQIIFDFDEALKTTGDTGVYLEYAHARACSIRRKTDEREIGLNWRPNCVPEQFTETERGLVEALTKFPGVAAKAGKTLRVSQLAEYAFDLATAFTNFYEHPDPDAQIQTPFIHLQDESLRLFRLSLVHVFQTVMANVLDLMGMPTLERI